jgi:deazaflavin-dependent oxidoreductase (nitroreductase family)
MTAATTPTESFPPLAEPPVNEAWQTADPYLHMVFKALNRYFMVPLHRAGLGAWVSMPIGGYMVLLRIRGRKSGVVRETPLNYLIAEGSVWVLAGFGPKTEWYRNLQADPHVEAWLPGRRVTGIAVEELDPRVRARILPALIRSTPLPGAMIGVNPLTAPDEAIIKALDWVPLLRITPDGEWLEPGADDPGGSAWIWRQALALVGSWVALRLAGRLIGGLLRAVFRRR